MPETVLRMNDQVSVGFRKGKMKAEKFHFRTLQWELEQDLFKLCGLTITVDAGELFLQENNTPVPFLVVSGLCASACKIW